MRKNQTTFIAIAAVALILAFASQAQAQGFLKYVSSAPGVVDNATCSRTTPCRSFQAAHDVVLSGGQVIALDSGDFTNATNPTLFITKSVTITGQGVNAGLGASNTSISIIQIGTAGINVNLRSISISSNTNGNDAIRVQPANVILHLEKCRISYPGPNGISFDSAGGQLFVKDTSIRRAGSTALSITAGRAFIDNSRMENNSTGINATGGAKVSVRYSVFSGNVGTGMSASGAGSEISIEECLVSNNNIGLSATTGGSMTLVNSVVSHNTGKGIDTGTGPTNSNPATGTIFTRQAGVGSTNTIESNGATNDTLSAFNAT